MNEEYEVFESDIDIYLQDYIESRGLDRNKIPSSQWAAAMTYIYDHVFKNSGLFKKNCTYDLDAVSRLLDKYCFLCSDYCQRICVDHFCLLSGIDRNTIYFWANEARRPGDARAKQIYIKLMQNSMMAADDLMVSKPGVNSIAYRNATETRYNRFMEKQQDNTAIDMTDLAARLGITDADIKALPEPQPEKEPVRHEFYDMDILEEVLDI